MLIASYGLLLSGGRGLRMRIGLHYVVFNVTASTLFLVALGLLYASLGSLNMAELSQRIAEVPPAQLTLVKATMGLLLLVFCAKAALMPLYLWLPKAYSRAPAAVAALFAIMTKVGLYSVLRIQMLWFGDDAGAMAGYGRDWMLWAGVATLVLGGLGALAATRLRVLISYLVIVSAATLFIAFSVGTPQVLSAGLYYLPHSSFVAAALFLVADLIRRRRGSASDRKEVVAPMPGKETPAVLFLIGAVSVAGLPPLSGFLAKAALLAGMPVQYTAPVWTAVLVSSLLVIMGLTRGHPPVLARAAGRSGSAGTAQGAAAPGRAVRGLHPAGLRHRHDPGRSTADALHRRHRRAAAAPQRVRAAAACDCTGDPPAMTAQRSLFRRLIPSPMLSIMVVAFWLLMSDSFTLGQIVLGLLLGVVVPLFAARLDREFARIGTLRPLPKLLCVTLWDILMSNIRVALQVLGPEKNIHPGFIWLPLDIANIHGIAALTSMITLTLARSRPRSATTASTCWCTCCTWRTRRT